MDIKDNIEIKDISAEELLSESNDRYLRLFAEFENYKKRVQKEKDDIRNNTKSNMISSILDLDSDLALARKQSKDDIGLDLIMSKLEKFLNSQGVETIQTDNYDVDLHEVISIVNPDGKNIIDVVSKGYLLNGKPIRFPKIILG